MATPKDPRDIDAVLAAMQATARDVPSLPLIGPIRTPVPTPVSMSWAPCRRPDGEYVLLQIGTASGVSFHFLQVDMAEKVANGVLEAVKALRSRIAVVGADAVPRTS